MSSMPSHTEIEVKLYAPDLGVVKRRLEEAGARLIQERVYERNVRYENAERTLTPAGIVVRLRQDTRVRLTYKDPGGLVGDGLRARFEAEVEVSDFDTMQLILDKLGYFPYMTYEKYRTAYELDWAEVALDEMPYGNFVEVEGDPDTIERAITHLELGGARRYSESYTQLFERVRQNLGLNVNDLTFANFEGVAVLVSAFESSSGT